MSSPGKLCRMCASRIPGQRAGPSRLPAIRSFSALPARPFEPVPFFTPPYRPSSPASYSRKGKEKAVDPGRDEDPELGVSDREWEMRVGRAMLHLQATLPHFFRPDDCAVEMCPPEVFSRNVELKLPVPFPVKISSLSAYSMVHTLTRNGMMGESATAIMDKGAADPSALHSDLSSSLDRMSLSPSPQAANAPAAAFFTKRIPAHRHKQVRIQLAIRGTPRLPPHNASPPFKLQASASSPELTPPGSPLAYILAIHLLSLLRSHLMPRSREDPAAAWRGRQRVVHVPSAWLDESARARRRRRDTHPKQSFGGNEVRGGTRWRRDGAGSSS